MESQSVSESSSRLRAIVSTVAVCVEALEDGLEGPKIVQYYGLD